jgi:hypothetical protein
MLNIERVCRIGVKCPAACSVHMDNLLRGILGIQVTLVGLLLGTLFQEVPPYDLLAVLLGVIGTIVVLAAAVDL